MIWWAVKAGVAAAVAAMVLYGAYIDGKREKARKKRLRDSAG